MTVRGRIAAGDEVLELPLDVGEQRARAEAEEVGREPAVAQLLLHEVEDSSALGGADAARGLEAHRVAGVLVVVADHAHHDEAEGERRVHALLAGATS